MKSNTNNNMASNIQKRENYLSSVDYFMGVALLTAQRSKDPYTQVGACIVNLQHKVIGTGYNSLTNGHNEDGFSWQRSENFLDAKHTYICHAELNAIVNCRTTDLNSCILYTTLFPCNECAKLIVQTGIKKIYFLSEKYSRPETIEAAKKIFKMTNVETIKLVPAVKLITLSY